MRARNSANLPAINWENDVESELRKSAGGVQGGNRRIHEARASAGQAIKDIRANKDLTEAARVRQIDEVIAKHQPLVKAGNDAARAAITEYKESAEKRLQGYAHPDPLCALEIPKDADQAERRALQGVNATRALTKVSVETEARRQLERALARDTGDGLEITKLYQAALVDGDDVRIAAIEREASVLLAAEGAESQHAIWQIVVDGAREERLEARLPDELKATRAYAEALVGALPIFDAIEAEAGRAEFYEKPSSPAINAAIQVLGHELAGPPR